MVEFTDHRLTGDIVKYVFENAIHKYLKIQNTCTNVHMFSEY